jgi:hypothetical protein
VTAWTSGSDSLARIDIPPRRTRAFSAGQNAMWPRAPDHRPAIGGSPRLPDGGTGIAYLDSQF